MRCSNIQNFAQKTLHKGNYIGVGARTRDAKTPEVADVATSTIGARGGEDADAGGRAKARPSGRGRSAGRVP